MSTAQPQSKAVRVASKIVLLFLLAILAVPLYFGLRPAAPGSAPVRPPEEKRRVRYFQPGDEVLIGEPGKGKWAVVADSATWERLLTVQRAKDTLGEMELRMQNRLIGVQGGTRAKIIQRDGDLWEVRVLEGPWLARSGWLTSEPFQWPQEANSEATGTP